MIEYIIALVAGFVSFISPCVLPLVPAYIGYMGGRVTQNVSTQVQADGTLVANRGFGQRFNTFMHGLAFVGGFTIVFVLLGVALAFVSTIGSTNEVTDIIGRVGGILIVFFGLHFSGLLNNVFIWLRQSGAVEQSAPGFGGVTGVILATFAIAASALLGYLNGVSFLVGDAYAAVASVLPILPDGSPFVIHLMAGLWILATAYVIGLNLFKLYNQSNTTNAGFVIGLGAISGLALGLVLLALTALGEGGIVAANAVHLLVFGLWGAGIGAIYRVQQSERSGFEIIVANPVFSAVVAVIGVGLISWGFTGTLLLWDPSAYSFWSGVVALLLVAGFLVGMVLREAFVEPGAFWAAGMDRVQYMLNVDTRKQMGSSENNGLLSSGFMGVVFAAGWSPCIGPTLGVALTLVGNNPTNSELFHAAGLMTAYSLGLGIPFLFAALALDSAQGGLRRITRHMTTIKIASGALLVMIGFSIGSGQLQQLSLRFSNQFGDFSYRVEQCTVGAVEGTIYVNQLGDCYTDTVNFRTLIGINNGTIDPVTFEEIEVEEEAIGPVDTPVSDNVDAIPEADIDVAPVDGVSIADEPLSVASAPVDAEIGLAIGNRAPNFTTVTTDGEEISLWDQQGKVVLLNFWYTTCGPCIVEMPEFEEAYQAFGGEDFTILAVNREEGPEAIAAFAEEVGGLSFPLLLDEMGDIQFEYNILGYPSTLLLDENGVIVFNNRGPITAEQIQELINEHVS